MRTDVLTKVDKEWAEANREFGLGPSKESLFKVAYLRGYRRALNQCFAVFTAVMIVLVVCSFVIAYLVRSHS